MSRPHVILTPVHACVKGARSQSLVVRVQVPPMALTDIAPRPSLNLGIVIDASHSMDARGPNGQRALDEAKRAALEMVGQLQETDRVAVVVYGEDAAVLLSSVSAAEAQLKLPALLAGVDLMGNTALHKGWLVGAEQIAPYVPTHGLSRVLLLSDGQANRGVTGVEQIVTEAQQLAEAGIGTSTYGLGPNFNEVLMTAMAQDGQAFYAESADALIPYFTSEFALMSATVGRQVRLQLTATVQGQPQTHLPLVCLNDYTRHDQAWRLPALIADQETWAAFEIAVPKLGKTDQLHLNAVVSWVDTQGHHLTQNATLEWAQGKGKSAIDAWAAERVKEVQAAQAAKKALREAQAGQWDAARQTLNAMGASAGSNAYVGGVAASLTRMVERGDLGALSKEAAYSSYAMSTRSAHTHEAVERLDDVFGIRKTEQGKAAGTVMAPPVDPKVMAEAGKGLIAHLKTLAPEGSFNVMAGQGQFTIMAYTPQGKELSLRASKVPAQWEGIPVQLQWGSRSTAQGSGAQS